MGRKKPLQDYYWLVQFWNTSGVNWEKKQGRERYRLSMIKFTFPCPVLRVVTNAYSGGTDTHHQERGSFIAQQWTNSSQGLESKSHLSTDFKSTFAFETTCPAFGVAQQYPASDPPRAAARRGRGRAASGARYPAAPVPRGQAGQRRGRGARPEPRGGRA